MLKSQGTSAQIKKMSVYLRIIRFFLNLILKSEKKGKFLVFYLFNKTKNQEFGLIFFTFMDRKLINYLNILFLQVGGVKRPSPLIGQPNIT